MGSNREPTSGIYPARYETSQALLYIMSIIDYLATEHLRNGEHC